MRAHDLEAFAREVRPRRVCESPYTKSVPQVSILERVSHPGVLKFLKHIETGASLFLLLTSLSLSLRLLSPQTRTTFW